MPIMHRFICTSCSVLVLAPVPGGQCTQVFAGWTMHPGNWHAERHIGKIATSRSRCEIFAVCSQLWIWACFQHLLAWGIFRLSFVDALWPLVQRDDASQKVHHTPPYSRVWFYLVTIPHLILFDPFSICSSLVHFDVWLPSLRAHQGAMHRRMLYIAVVLAPRTGIATCLQQRSAKDPSPTSRNPKWYRAPVKCIWAT